jgi:CRISPR/Cas system CMR-associated protein Cmr5 small subunit
MTNLEQIRARNALNAANSGLNFSGQDGGKSVAKKIPPHILNHGLLQTLAFAKSIGKKPDGEGYKNLCDQLALHLTNVGVVKDCRTTDQLITTLASGDSVLLKRATSEALAWFNYARRFI